MTDQARHEWAAAVLLAQRFPTLRQGNLCGDTILAVERQRQAAFEVLRLVNPGEAGPDVWAMIAEILGP